MGFTNDAQLLAFIRADAVQTPFNEFVDDFLNDNANANFQDSDFNVVMGHVGHNYAVYPADTPDKQGWVAENHFARFIVRTYYLARSAASTWRGVIEDDLALVGVHLFELLLYLVRPWIEETEV
jgi:hypothetical protein